MWEDPKQDGGEEKGGETSPMAAPTLSLPKGGGAIRGIGEKFAANPVTGTGSLSVPIATSPGRGGFGPKVSLSYDSGAGNGPFGIGWNLSVPSITRKTDKGLPKYQDAEESDVFILSGSEDLVPTERRDRTVGGILYEIQLYRPRIEGLFARIERWTNPQNGDVYWRSLSRDNVTTFYGRTPESRITDPADLTRIFSWMICETYDGKGNAILYEYKKEDELGVDPSAPQEKNRLENASFAQRYLKHIRYGNQNPFVPGDNPDAAHWFFQVVFDYGEHDAEVPKPSDHDPWLCRHDPFSSYRAGFEIRSNRLCQRVLMFHHFPDEENVGNDCLVRSTDFLYRNTRNRPDDEKKGNPIASFIASITQTSYKREGAGYRSKALPPLEFGYTEARIDDTLCEADDESVANLPAGLDHTLYQWTDLEGNGLGGVLSEQAGGWFFKPSGGGGNFESLGLVARLPAPIGLAGGRQQLMDLAGDGRIDVVQVTEPLSGFYERNWRRSWNSFIPFESMARLPWNDPNLRWVDLTGDGHADLLITEDDFLVWHPSLGEQGFGPVLRVPMADDEEKGPCLLFADGTESIFLSDLSGDGLSDLVRIRNGEICYWPNLGYCRFGAKVTMDRAPVFDRPDRFDPRLIRLADVDGSGVTDIFYLSPDGVHLWFNESGNSWSEPVSIPAFPEVDGLASVEVLDLLGSGTACLVWSSPLPGEARRPLRYLDLMGGVKPHLLVSVKNNLGAETRVSYAPSTKFYAEDRRAGNPWVTRLPFPVHVVERVENYDFISRNRFVTRYAYHHGYFDGLKEREFRGFGMVEQWDTEEYASLSASDHFPDAVNIDAASQVPPVLTKTWFHTGSYLQGGYIGLHYAHEYYGAPKPNDPNYAVAFQNFLKTLLPDTILPDGLSLEEEREACRALKGSVLHQEIYAKDGSTRSPHPYTVSEFNYTVRREQPILSGHHGVFLVHPRETLRYRYERDPGNSRVGHAMTLEVGKFGEVLKSVAIGYGRLTPHEDLSEAWDQAQQSRSLLTYQENDVTEEVDQNDAYRVSLPCDSRSYELTGFSPAGPSRFTFDDFIRVVAGKVQLRYDLEIAYEATPTGGRQRRLIKQIRTLYRPDDLGVSRADSSALLPLKRLEPLALPGESYQLAFTPGLLAEVYHRPRQGLPAENLLPNRSAVLSAAGYVDLEGDGNWWKPSGRLYFHPDLGQEVAEAFQHFFMPRLFVTPFGNKSTVQYDPYDLLILETKDPLNNTSTAGERNPDGSITQRNDYRVLRPSLITDPNEVLNEVVFDALGLVAASAVSKNGEGDSLVGVAADLSAAELDAFFTDPYGEAENRLGPATTRTLYDPGCYARSGDPLQPPRCALLARKTHASDPVPPEGLEIQISAVYSDGLGREIQKKLPAEAGPMVPGSASVEPRWVGSGWTIFNNKGSPVKQYEPYFSASFDFEFERTVGVSPTLCYDPLGRVIATLRPDHNYEKMVFDSWSQESWDVNDTISATNPTADPDVGDFFNRLPVADYWPNWYTRRAGGGMGLLDQAAAEKALRHRGTPTRAYFDTLGRSFLSVARNRYDRNGVTVEEEIPTRFQFDIAGKPRRVRDAKIDPAASPLGRLVIQYDYDLLGNTIHQQSFEAGERWMLQDVGGQPCFAWDNLGRNFKTEYDELRRPSRSSVQGADPNDLAREIAFDRVVYGEDPNTGLTPSQVLQANLRTKPYRHFDTAGIVTNEAYDFKGNLLQSKRVLTRNYKEPPDWSATPAPSVETEEFVSATTYDAINRPLTLTPPDGSVIFHTYNEANLLESLSVQLPGAAEATPFVTDIDYDAKGQRERIEYGDSMAETVFTYDRDTFRLTKLTTTRQSDDAVLQDLFYTYDAAGNITHIEDGAQETIFFNNRQVDPASDYLYDAIYRLIQAQGREHLGQTAGGNNPPTPHNWNNAFHSLKEQIGNGDAMGTYAEEYLYDTVGNILEMKHRGSDPANPGWSRTYYYEEASPFEAGVKNNRLSRTSVGRVGQTPQAEPYSYDAHGNMIRLPHLPILRWDFHDQLKATSQQTVTTGAPEITYYVYDSDGQRVRKVTERQAPAGQTPTRRKERRYLGGFEIYREYEADGDTVNLERQTLHVMDDKQRIALVETKTVDTAATGTLPITRLRYQFGNHLGSACLELNEDGEIISYEEYHPYGSTSYQGVRGDAEVPVKRYRYSGKERDEENGFYYHGARYYAPWLARWTSCDPKSIESSTCLYQYCRGNPLTFVDPDGKQDLDAVQAALDDARARKQAVDRMSANANKNARAGPKLVLPAEMQGGASPDEAMNQEIASLEKSAEELRQSRSSGDPGLMAKGTWNWLMSNTVGLALIAVQPQLLGSEEGLQKYQELMSKVKTDDFATQHDREMANAVGYMWDAATFLVAIEGALAKGATTVAPKAAQGGLVFQTAQKGAAVIPLLTDAQLAARAEALYVATVTNYMKSIGRPLTPGALRFFRRRMTVAVLQGMKDGKVVTYAAVNTPYFSSAFELAAKGGGELIVEPTEIFRISEETGLPWSRGFSLHAEPTLYTATEELGLEGMRVGSSNPGCFNCVIEGHRFGVFHVNPVPFE